MQGCEIGIGVLIAGVNFFDDEKNSSGFTTLVANIKFLWFLR